MSRFDNKKPSKFLVSLVTIILLILVVLLGWLLWPSQPSQVDASPSPTLSVVVPTETPEAPKVTKPSKEQEDVEEHAPAEEPVSIETPIEAPAPVDSSDVYVTAEEVIPIVEEPAPLVEVVEHAPVVEPAPVAQVVEPAPVAEVPASGAYSSPNYAMWESIAPCESGGNWGIQSGNGYYGGLQFLPSSWAAAGGVGSPADASKEEQMRIADNLLAVQGPGAWGCYGK